jgi:hypothetical protein
VLARSRATGRVIEYQLTPPGVNRRWLRGTSVVEDGDGALRLAPTGLPGLTYLGIPQEDAPDRPVRPVAALIGGPVDIVVGDDYFIGRATPGSRKDFSLEPFTAPEAAAFLEGLRPVGTEEWRAVLDEILVTTGDGRIIDRTAVEAPSILDPPMTVLPERRR